jgi:hypothetical protein
MALLFLPEPWGEAMTLKIAVDNTNVEAFPGVDLRDIALMARKFADSVEAGEFGEIETAMVMLEGSEGIQTFGWGDVVSFRESIGMLEIAKAHLLGIMLDGEE